jgi:hypothetical protein
MLTHKWSFPVAVIRELPLRVESGRLHAPSADSYMFARRMAICVAASLVFVVLSLTFASSDLGAVLCFGIALVSALLLFAFGVAKKGRQRLAALLVVMTYVFAAMLLKSNYLASDYWRASGLKKLVSVLGQRIFLAP